MQKFYKTQYNVEIKIISKIRNFQLNVIEGTMLILLMLNNTLKK